MTTDELLLKWKQYEKKHYDDWLNLLKMIPLEALTSEFIEKGKASFEDFLATLDI